MEEAMAEKIPRTERSEGEMDTEGKGETSCTSTEYQSGHKEGHVTNVYLTDFR